MTAMRKRSHDRDGLLLGLSLAIILGTAALYFWLLTSWFSAPVAPVAGGAPAEPAPRESSTLEPARRAFREQFLDPRSWISLSQALGRAGRPVDSFYVMQGARDFFGDEAFFPVHTRLVLKAPEEAPAGSESELRERVSANGEDPAAVAALARLYGEDGRMAQAHKTLDSALASRPDDRRLLLAKAQLTADPGAAIPLYARAAHADPSSDEGHTALRQLQRYASLSEEGAQGETGRLGREALEELRKAHPTEPGIFSALALAFLARGDRTTAKALVVEMGRAGRSAAAARVEGALAMAAHDTDLAISRFTEAWEADPEDMESAERLASLYSGPRGDEEGALPYEIALYRHDPRRLRGVEGLDVVIRRTLDARRQTLLKNVPAEGLGKFFRSEDASLRAEACARAAALQDPRWIDALAELLDDDTEIVRHNADYALYRVATAHPEAVKARRDDWLQGDRALLRARGLNLFADLWPNEALPMALRALDDRSVAVRYLAKTLVFDRYYRDHVAAQRAAAQYLAHEQDPFARALLARDRSKTAGRR